VLPPKTHLSVFEGRVETLTSFSDTSGNIAVNQVKRTYNGFGQVTIEQQDHDGTVNGSTPQVQYAYSTTADQGSRLTKITYPNGRNVNYLYDSIMYGSNLYTTISRLIAIAVDDGSDLDTAPDVLENYSYFGLSTVVVRSRPENLTQLSYAYLTTQDIGPVWNTAAAPNASNRNVEDIYIGLANHGRVVEQRWEEVNSDGDSVQALDHFK